MLYFFQDAIIWKRFYPLAHRDLVWECSERYEVDPYLILAIMKIESRFDPKAVSRRGAKGLMQLMPDTASWIAAMKNLEIDDSKLFLPEISIPMGTWYLSYLIRQFGDEIIAIAAYNAGQGNVQRWLEQGIWNGTLEDAKNIPFQETRSYVVRVKVAWRKYFDIYGR